jgi:hypothetical protein
MEDQLGTLGLALNVMVLFNTLSSTLPSSTWPPAASRSPTTWSPGCPRSR